MNNIVFYGHREGHCIIMHSCSGSVLLHTVMLSNSMKSNSSDQISPSNIVTAVTLGCAVEVSFQATFIISRTAGRSIKIKIENLRANDSITFLTVCLLERDCDVIDNRIIVQMVLCE